jgi:thiazole tautomerase (transcriptional regulator TenI)
VAGRGKLVLVSPDSHDPDTVAAVRDLLPALALHADALILRWTGTDVRSRIEAARALAAVETGGMELLLRDRFDIARAVGLAGVQLPEVGLPATAIREHWASARIGVSRHDATGLVERSAGSDFALVSPVLPTRTKPGRTGLGLRRLTELAHLCPVPLLALGGIDLTNVAEVMRCGVAGIAVRGAVFEAGDPIQAASSLRSLIDSA